METHVCLTARVREDLRDFDQFGGWTTRGAVCVPPSMRELSIFGWWGGVELPPCWGGAVPEQPLRDRSALNEEVKSVITRLDCDHSDLDCDLWGVNAQVNTAGTSF